MVKLNMIDSKKIIEMKITHEFIKAIFVERPNRFLTKIKINNELFLSHLPDPGRLKELLIPGVQLLVKRENGINRKTRFSTQAVYQDKTLISLNTLIPNKFVSYLLKNKLLPFLKEWEFDKQEVSYGKNRFDFQLKKNNMKMIVEVKSVTLVENTIAKFPDAITERGKRHVEHLSNLNSQNLKTMVLFVIQRPDADSFAPQWERDPKFSNALLKASKNGVCIKSIKMKMTPKSLIYMGEVPHKLTLQT
jgi:sugar fermentation stimulation protein A